MFEATKRRKADDATPKNNIELTLRLLGDSNCVGYRQGFLTRIEYSFLQRLLSKRISNMIDDQVVTIVIMIIAISPRYKLEETVKSVISWIPQGSVLFIKLFREGPVGTKGSLVSALCARGLATTSVGFLSCQN